MPLFLCFTSCAHGPRCSLPLVFPQGAVPAIVRAAQRHSSDAGCVNAACTVFMNLAAIGGEAALGSVQCAAEGACAVAVEALRRHVSDAHVTAGACSAVANLAGKLEGQIALSKAGAVPCLVTALRRHEDNAKVVRRAVTALSNWTQIADHSRDERTRSASTSELSRAGAVPVLVSALRRHVTDKHCAEFACRALLGLAIDPAARAQMIGLPAASASGAAAGRSGAAGGAGAASSTANLAGFAATVAAAIEAHAADANVAAFACRLLFAVVASLGIPMPVAVSDDLLRSGALTVMTTVALRRHPRSHFVASSVCFLLSAVTLSAASRAALIRDGALVAVVAAAPYHTAGEGQEELVVPSLVSALKKLAA